MENSRSEQLKINETDAETLHLLVDWNVAAKSVPVHHANQVVVQVHEEDVFITFFQVNPPVILGTPEEQREQLHDTKTLVPDCVGRITISPDFCKRVIQTLAETMQKYEASKKGENV